jgi:DivIVA domain-containing protein
MSDLPQSLKDLLETFDSQTFKTVKLQEGYDLDEVDDFLDALREKIISVCDPTPTSNPTN